MTRAALLAALAILALASAPGGAETPTADIALLDRAMAQPQARCTADGVAVRGGRVVAAEFYRAMTGFAAQAGTTGGLGRARFLVTRADDPAGRAPAAGSLRDAVARANAAGGGWIAFAPALQGQAIALSAPLRLGSDITLDGGCARPLVTGQFKGSLIYLAGSRNVVIARLALEHAGPGTQGDCITVSHAADRVWLAFMRLRRCHDGLIDVTRDGRPGPVRVTISNNRFLDHDKAMLVTGGPVEPSCALSAQPVQVTVFRNLFLRTGQRHPRASGDVFVDLAQNVIAFAPRQRAGGREGGSYGTLASDGARVLIDGTAYVAPAGTRRFRIAADRVDAETGGSCRRGRLDWRRSVVAGPGEPVAAGAGDLARARPYRLPAAPAQGVAGMIRDLQPRTGPAGTPEI